LRPDLFMRPRHPKLRPLTQAPPGAMTYDLLVLTAANASQARGYEAQLSALARAERLEGCREWMVVPDPGDRRVGSGGATLLILSRLLRERRSLLRERILILHSGGDSRRLPAYAAMGKAFVPLPMEDDAGHQLTLFDLILQD